MSEKTAKQVKCKSPPDELHVYCLDGLMPGEGEKGLGRGFLGNWEEGDSSFLFFEEPALERVLGVISRYHGLRLVDSHVFPYEDWQGARFERLEVGGFEIQPAWSPCDSGGASGRRILLDPGVVFGSGLHPTTRDCLRALEFIWRRDHPKKVLDIGTGTGILAVAAVILGAQEVSAVDLNPLCVSVAARNAALNGLEDRIRAQRLDAFDAVELEGDLVVANIHFEVIRGLLEMEAFRSRRWLILSGLMRSQVRKVKDRLRAIGMEVIREWDCEMIWHTLAVRGQPRCCMGQMQQKQGG